MDDKKTSLIKRALTDPAFKSDLLKNPAAAILRATGTKLPDGVTLKVLEDSASVAHLVLPAAPAARAGGELTERDLESVVGGIGSLPGNMTKYYCRNTNATDDCYGFPQG